MMKKEATIKIPVEPNSPMFNAFCGFPPSFTLTMNVPTIEVKIPAPAKIKGRTIGPKPSYPSAKAPAEPLTIAKPKTIVAMIEPT